MPATRTISARVYARHDSARLKEMRFSAPPTLTASTSAAIRMALSGTFAHDDDIDYVNYMLEPVLIINGIEYPLGVYMIGTLTRTHGASSVEDEIEAYDQCLLLQQTRLENRLHFAKGEQYTRCVTRLLMMAGIGQASVTQSSEMLQTDREDWDVGTDLLTIANELLNEINYEHIWFNFAGEAVIQPRRDASIDNPTVRYAADAYSLLQAGSTSTIDSYDAPNVFIAMVPNPDYDGWLTATAVNDNPGSALSTVQRGRRIVKKVQLNNIASQGELQKYVNNMRMNSMYASEKITFATAVNANHQIDEVVELYSKNMTGVYLETGWSMELAAGGTMQHTAERMIYSL